MFKLIKSAHGRNTIQSHTLTSDQVKVIRHVVTNYYMSSESYEVTYASYASLQGCETPTRKNLEDGLVLIEFRTEDVETIQAFIDYVNSVVFDETKGKAYLGGEL